MSTSPDILEGLLRSPSGEDAIDRKALAGLLIEIAQSLKPELRAQQNGVHPGDLQLEQLRTLLVGREIETLSRLAGMVDDPERLAAVIGNVLPTAIAQATSERGWGMCWPPSWRRRRRARSATIPQRWSTSFIRRSCQRSANRSARPSTRRSSGSTKP